MAEVGGVRRPVNVSFILDDRPAEACIGEWVLIHVGFAMARIDADEAAPETTLVSIAHGQGVSRFHTRVLYIEDGVLRAGQI